MKKSIIIRHLDGQQETNLVSSLLFNSLGGSFSLLATQMFFFNFPFWSLAIQSYFPLNCIVKEKTSSCRVTGEKDVAFKVLFCGVCHSDLHMAKNEWGISTYPLVPGYVNNICREYMNMIACVLLCIYSYREKNFHCCTYIWSMQWRLKVN